MGGGGKGREGGTVRQVLTADQDAVQVALRAAVGDVAPVLVAVDLPQLGEPVEHPDLRSPKPCLRVTATPVIPPGPQLDALTTSTGPFAREA